MVKPLKRSRFSDNNRDIIATMDSTNDNDSDIHQSVPSKGTITTSFSNHRNCVYHRHRPTISANSASVIRNRFLNRLGITKKPKGIANSVNSATASKTNNKSNTQPLKVKTTAQSNEYYVESLKDDYGNPDKSFELDSLASTVSSTESTTSSIRSTTSKSVSFDTAVTVHTIPNRLNYSNRIRSALWTSSTQVRQNMIIHYMEQQQGFLTNHHLEEDYYGTQNCYNQDYHNNHGEQHYYNNNYYYDHVQQPPQLGPQNLNWRFCAVRAMQMQQG